MTKDTQTVTDWCPIYEKDGNELIVLSPDFRADNEETAKQIGLGSMLVECIVWGMKYLRVQGINRELFPHVKAQLNRCPVAIISGPLFDACSTPAPSHPKN